VTRRGNSSPEGGQSQATQAEGTAQGETALWSSLGKHMGAGKCRNPGHGHTARAGLTDQGGSFSIHLESFF
jgi:hypothetical protein